MKQITDNPEISASYARCSKALEHLNTAVTDIRSAFRAMYPLTDGEEEEYLEDHTAFVKAQEGVLELERSITSHFGKVVGEKMYDSSIDSLSRR